MTKISIVLAVLISFVISAAAGPVIIPILRKLKVGQTVRDDGPQTHLKKNGTPTMGGIIFLLAVLVTSLIYAPHYPKVIPILFMTVGFGIVGFLDDFIKVVLHRSEGLTPAQKMAGQLVVTAVFAYYMVNISDVGLTMLVPFFPEISINLGWLSIPLLFFVVIGTVNGTNFTDGLDGLAASVTVMVAVFFSVVAIGTEAGIAPVTLAVAGGLMGFLLFNVYHEYAAVYFTGRIYLSGGSAVCYHSGYVF